jgi:hypothetical protein
VPPLDEVAERCMGLRHDVRADLTSLGLPLAPLVLAIATRDGGHGRGCGAGEFLLKEKFVDVGEILPEDLVTETELLSWVMESRCGRSRSTSWRW